MLTSLKLVALRVWVVFLSFPILSACKTMDGSEPTTALVVDDNLVTHWFGLEGEANYSGTVFWKQCLSVDEKYRCQPVPDAVPKKMPFPDFRRNLANAIIKDLPITEFSGAYGNLLGAVITQGENLYCPKTQDLVQCQHADYQSYNNEFAWLKAAFNGSPATKPDGGETPPPPADDIEQKPTPTPSQGSGFVAENGQLNVKDGRLYNAHGAPLQLKGISSHGLHWYGHLANYDSIKWLRDNWKINVFRAAMYTDEGGYLTNKSVKNKVKEIVDAAKELGIYVIIDWHILRDRDPLWHKSEAIQFFREMATLYKDTPNVIYEIANEPNSGVNWYNSIRPYADEVIREIRAIDPNNLIIVGTGTWSQDIHEVIGNTINARNVMYVVHFYAGSHGASLRDRISWALKNKVGVFISECGVSSADGHHGVYWDAMREWVDFLNRNNISWVVWSWSDKDESSALILPGQSQQGANPSLSEAGRLVKEVLGR